MAALSHAWRRQCATAAELQAFAAGLAPRLPPGSVLGLQGGFGAGKTTFVQGLARGLEVADLAAVVSPTYALAHVYPAARTTLVHMDFFRLEGAQAAESLGLGEQLYNAEAVVVVEWADRCAELMPPHSAWIHFSVQRDHSRALEVRGLAAPPESP